MTVRELLDCWPKEEPEILENRNDSETSEVHPEENEEQKILDHRYTLVRTR